MNLYTQEYFQLIYDRLNEGGMTTYWLPAHELTYPAILSMLKGFCSVFADCALWAGANLNWMMTGTRNAKSTVSEAHLQKQWENPGVAPLLRELGFEKPEVLGSTFIADASAIADS